MKYCYLCKILKESLDFSKSQLLSKYGTCRSCVKNKNKKYRKENTEKVKTINAEYRKNNPDHNRNYRINNSEKIKLQKKEYVRDRYANDLNFKIRINVSVSINQLLSVSGNSKNGNSIINFLPYSINDLKSHLENQFESWMTWKKWGKYNPKTWDDNDQTTWTWQLDHIVPQSIFSYQSMKDDNFKKCWALSNLRPLSAKQNVLDGNRR
jgi:hypothetical protein